MAGLCSITKKSVPSALIFTMVACSSSYQRVSTDGLATRSTINVVARISENGNVQSGAYTRGEGAAEGVVGGASAGVIVAAEGLAGPQGLIMLPVGVLLTPVFATVGGVAGAASGTSKSREDIMQAVHTINRAYEPAKFEAIAEREIAKHLSDGFSGNKKACTTSRKTRKSCSQGPNSSELILYMTFNLVPSKSNGAGTGNIDVLGKITVTTKPLGLLKPNCIFFGYRSFAGNIFDLAKNNGAALDRKFFSAINQFSQQFPKTLNANSGSDFLNSRNEKDIVKKRNLRIKNSGAEWTRAICSSKPRPIETSVAQLEQYQPPSPTNDAQVDPYKPRPPINMGGYGGWPPKASDD